MKRRYVQAGFFAFLFMILMVSTASAANLEPDQWSKSGQGTTTVETTADGSLKFSYDLNSSSIFQGQWWTFQSTAASTETFTFDWTYYAFHSWFQAQARAYAYADGPNGRQTVTLYNGYGQINTSGTTTLTLTEGYTYGFQIYGYNYDGTRVAQGNLTISGADDVAPTTVLSTNPSGLSWVNSDVQVTLNATDDQSAIANTYYRVNGGAQQTGTSFAITTEGENLISYWSVDAAGNVEAAKSATVKVDKTAPATSDDAPAAWQAGDVAVTLSARDSGSGVGATYYQVNGGDVQSGNTVAITEEGSHTLTYWSVDAVGNVEVAHSKTILIDKTAPQLQVTLDQTSLWSPNHKLVQINATILSRDSNLESVILTSITSNEADEGLGDGDVAQDIQGAVYGTYDTNFLLRSERAGNGSGRIYTITYTATDKAGNQTVYLVTVEVPHDKGNKKGKGK